MTNNKVSLEFNTLPNYLTLFRVLMVPVIVLLLFQRTEVTDIWAGWLFVVAAFTDLIDGYIARKRGLITIYGQLLDPLADKFIVTAALIMLQELGRIHPAWVILLISREMAITGLRALASAEGMIIAASTLAKWKTTFQMIALPLLMLGRDYWGLPLMVIADISLYLAIALSVYTAVDYCIAFVKAINLKHRS